MKNIIDTLFINSDQEISDRLKKGDPINEGSLYALIRGGKLDLVNIVIKNPNIVSDEGLPSTLNSSFLEIAILADQPKIAKLLHEKEILLSDDQLKTIIETKTLDPKVTMKLAKDYLLYAIQNDNLQTFILIMEAKQLTLEFAYLNEATALNRCNIMNYIIENNRANVKDMVDEQENNLLFYATTPAMVELLHKGGVFINHKNHNHETPLDYIIQRVGDGIDTSALKTSKKMIDLGANPSKPTLFNDMPLLDYYKTIHQPNVADQEKAINEIAEKTYALLKSHKSKSNNQSDFVRDFTKVISILSKDELTEEQQKSAKEFAAKVFNDTTITKESFLKRFWEFIKSILFWRERPPTEQEVCDKARITEIKGFIDECTKTKTTNVEDKAVETSHALTSENPTSK